MSPRVGDKVKIVGPMGTPFNWFVGVVERVVEQKLFSHYSVLVRIAHYGCCWFSKDYLQTQENSMEIAGYDVKIISNGVAQVGCAKVTFHEVTKLKQMMEDYVPPPKINVGSFVRVKDGYWSLAVKGKYGKVLSLNETVAEVEFSERIHKGGSCCGKTKEGHGWSVNIDYLELVD
jgi:hypothetical protein